jgi:GTPase SAR1 and related small G proteins
MHANSRVDHRRPFHVSRRLFEPLTSLKNIRRNSYDLDNFNSMSFINFVSGEVEFKIVYYGCALGGKTSSLGYIHERVDTQDRGSLVLLPTQNDRTLFFDFLPVDGGNIKGFKARFKLWTVPGQVMYDATRQLVLRGADGVVFIVDSQWHRMEANLESFRNLEQNLAGMESGLERVSLVFFYNKRDLPEDTIAPVEAIDLLFRHRVDRCRRFAGDCISGKHVFNALNQVTQSVLREFLIKDDLENYEAYR